MLKTYSKFYYNFIIDDSNCYLDFNDGTGVRSAKIPFGSYTLYTLSIELTKQMTSVSPTHTFSVVTDRADRIYTISSIAGGNFDILFSTGPNAELSISNVIGFESIDYLSSNSYSGLYSSGDVYYPQFYLQSFIDADFNKYPISSVVNRSSSGSSYEVVTFGLNSLYKFEIKYTTDIDLEENSYIKNNQNGVSELNKFMSYCVNKYEIEFMKDENDSDNFYIISLESTPQSQDGVSYELAPSYSEEIPEFYTLGGQLVFRRID